MCSHNIATAVIFLVFTVSSTNISPQWFMPRVAAAPGDGHMLLFWDGGMAPTGWTCVSCNPGDDFYQSFPRGNTSYGGTGGSATHVHTSTDSISLTLDAANAELRAGTSTIIQSHEHTLSVVHSTASNLPNYRQLQIIRHDTAGEPTLIPSGAIAFFDTTVPAGWTAYGAQNGFYPYGEATAGTTGGSNTHSHPLTITIGVASGTQYASRNGSTQVVSAGQDHIHTAAGSSDSVNHEPPYVEVIFGKISSDSAPQDGMKAMWDNDEPANWTKQSASGGAFYQRFLKGAATYGATGGSETHTHADTNIITSGPTTTTNARLGTDAASDTHTHTVTVADYSDENHLPPYRDVIIAKRVPQPEFEQSSFRFYKNIDGTDVGLPLATQNTTAAIPRQGVIFRLRLTLHVSTEDLLVGAKNFKLQVATRSGTCDTSFVDEVYADVQAGSGDIQFIDNPVPADGVALTTNANDPTHGGDTIRAQTYEESNNFTNSVSTIAAGEDGLWDFVLEDVSAPASTNYCFRVVQADGTLLDTYTHIPEIITDDGNGHMLLLYDGGSIPSGWSCVSCAPGDDFYQRFIRGEGSYGSFGGSSTHTHTVASSFSGSTSNGVEDQAGSGVATGAHTHTFTPTISTENNEPPYRQLKVIRADSSGVVDIPSGAITYFDAAVPAGWTRYSAQDGLFVRGENTAGTTGGSATHSHTITGTTGVSVGSTGARTNGSTVVSAADTHTHTVNGSTDAVSNEPPFIEVILGQTASTVAVPLNTIVMWDNNIPVSWTDMSSSGMPLYQRFVKPSAAYGITGGSATHSHADTVIATSPPSTTGVHRSGTANADGTHGHDVSLTSFSTESTLPPYVDVLFAKLGSMNMPPNSPVSLDQIRTSNSVAISVGGWANSSEVRFEADASDSDNPDSLQLCVEVELIGTAFDNVDTLCGPAVAYSGSPVAVNVTISSLTNASLYHWQARIRDGGGAYSSYVSFGANLESETDFAMDAVDPSGSVYDGSSTGVDLDYNDGSLDALSANWSFTDPQSGVASYEYAIGTTQGAIDVLTWTAVGTSTAETASTLTLSTSEVYYFSVRTRDVADNVSITNSDGQRVAPTLSFSSSGDVVFDNLNSANNYTSTKSTTLTTSTNAYNGYVIRAFVNGNLTSQAGDAVVPFSGGTYAAPDEWLPGDIGYGYTSNDTSIQGVNLFSPATCLGGGLPPCYAPFNAVVPGDIVADNTSLVSGTPITNENFIITHRVTTPSDQPAGTYTAEVTYVVNAIY